MTLDTNSQARKERDRRMQHRTMVVSKSSGFGYFYGNMNKRRQQRLTATIQSASDDINSPGACPTYSSIIAVFPFSDRLEAHNLSATNSVNVIHNHQCPGFFEEGVLHYARVVTFVKLQTAATEHHFDLSIRLSGLCGYTNEASFITTGDFPEQERPRGRHGGVELSEASTRKDETMITRQGLAQEQCRCC